MNEWFQLACAVLSPVFAAGGAYAAVRVKLDWHKERIDSAHQRLDHHDDEIQDLIKGYRA